MSFLTRLNGCSSRALGIVVGGGGGYNRFKGNKMSNNNSAIITGTIMLLLLWTFIGDCGGNPFQSGGQDEVEEDTSQGSLREKFPLSLRNPVASFRMRNNRFDNDDDENSENEDPGLRKFGYETIQENSWPSKSEKDEYQRQYNLLRHFTPTNYAGFHKRSLGIRPLPYSTSARYFPEGLGRVRDRNEEDEERRDLERQQNARDASLANSGSVYEATTSAPDINSSESSQDFQMRRRLSTLRNQYGEKWFAFVGPYAYRKRQILYRQCFFNPISCF